jgi:hypothetical protein
LNLTSSSSFWRERRAAGFHKQKNLVILTYISDLAFGVHYVKVTNSQVYFI